MGEEGYKIETDEKRIHNRSDEAADILNDSDYIYDNPAFESYLNRIAQKLLDTYPYTHDVSIRMRVLKDPEFNAFAFANGFVYFHVGIIALAENEAQLASIMAHEITHVLERHLIKKQRSLYNKTAFLSLFDGLGVYALFPALMTVSSMAGFSQSLESRADVGGFDMLKKAGYDVNQAPKMFSGMIDYLKGEKIKTPFFFSSHPKLKKRVKNFNRLITKNNLKDVKGRVNSDEFNGFINDVLLENIHLVLSRGYFSTAEKNVERYIKKNPDDALGYYYRGEVYRQWQNKKKKKRDKAEDFDKAILAYDQALKYDAQHADAYKGKARIFQRQKKHDKAKKLFKKYLALSNDQDPYIQQYLNKE